MSAQPEVIDQLFGRLSGAYDHDTFLSVVRLFVFPLCCHVADHPVSESNGDAEQKRYDVSHHSHAARDFHPSRPRDQMFCQKRCGQNQIGDDDVICLRYAGVSPDALVQVAYAVHDQRRRADNWKQDKKMMQIIQRYLRKLRIKTKPQRKGICDKCSNDVSRKYQLHPHLVPGIFTELAAVRTSFFLVSSRCHNSLLHLLHSFQIRYLIFFQEICSV